MPTARRGFIRRTDFDPDVTRPVATVIVTGGETTTIRWDGTTFYVDNPTLPALVTETTIRKAFAVAASGAGWG